VGYRWPRLYGAILCLAGPGVWQPVRIGGGVPRGGFANRAAGYGLFRLGVQARGQEKYLMDATIRRRRRTVHKKHPYETKVAACASYLLGHKLEYIEAVHGVSGETVLSWIKARKCFKLRNRTGARDDQGGNIRG